MQRCVRVAMIRRENGRGTSGTTGNPKNALHSHRAIVLNALTICMPSVLSLAPQDAVLPVVSMLHINVWFIPYAAPIGGFKLVLPGLKLDNQSLYEFIESEKVTCCAGVPSIWPFIFAYINPFGHKFSTMHRTAVGGLAMPQALTAKFMEEYQVEVRHG